MSKRYIRNYVVKGKNVKVDSQNRLINYFYNTTHKNHTETKIINPFNIEPEKYKNDFSDELVDRVFMNTRNYAKNKKGGRKLKDIAKSYTFNLPRSIKCSEEELLKINEMVKVELLELIVNSGIDLDESDLFTAIHFQDNRHWHLMLPLLDKNGKNIRFFKEPSFLVSLKVMFTLSVDKVMGLEVKKTELLTPEQRKHNKTVRELKSLITRYEDIMAGLDPKLKAYAFFKNQITTLERTVKADNIEDKYLVKINKAIDEINRSSAIKSKIDKIAK